MPYATRLAGKERVNNWHHANYVKWVAWDEANPWKKTKGPKIHPIGLLTLNKRVTFPILVSIIFNLQQNTRFICIFYWDRNLEKL